METRMESRSSLQAAINGDTLRAAVSRLLDDGIFDNLKFHGNTSWKFCDLILLVLVWVWTDDQTLTGAFTKARDWSSRVLNRVAVTTYNGLLKALVTWTKKLMPLIREQLHSRMEAASGTHWRIGRWFALAVDGARISTPRTKENEKAFCAPNYGNSAMAKYRRKKNKKGKKACRVNSKKPQPVKPQIWLTLLLHLGLRMPWCWRSGPSYSSERDHFAEMLRDEKFPENALFCGDAGFTGYELWKSIHDAKHAFVFRVGSNVTLLRKLGYVEEKLGLVYCWPNRVAKRKQPPLVLRLFTLRVGRCPMWLVSNVLDEKQLSEQEVVQLYRGRWGVELQFRTLKQTFGRGKLRSESPERALVELDWSLLGLWMIQLFAVQEQVGIGAVPERCSAALAIRVVRSMVERWWDHLETSFEEELRCAHTDSYKRSASKKARYRPENKKDRPKAGKPRIIIAKRTHKMLLKKLYDNAA